MDCYRDVSILVEDVCDGDEMVVMDGVFIMSVQAVLKYGGR